MSGQKKFPSLEAVKNFHPIARIFESRMATAVFSVITAVVLWFVISITVYPTAPITVTNVPLVVDLTGTAAAADGYSMISCDVEEVTVRIEGNRSQVGKLTADTLTAYAIIPNITTAGTKNLGITVKSADGTDFTIKSISPSTVNVKVDKIKTVTVDVKADLTNIKSTEGSIINEEAVAVTPATVDVTGPAQLVSQIKNANVLIESPAEIGAAAKMVSEKLTFCDANGNSIYVDDKTNLQYELTQYTVDIPVQYPKEMDITYLLRSVPSTFDEDFLRSRLKLSADKVTLAAPDQSLANTEEFNLDTITLSDITLDFSKNYALEAPEGYDNLSNINTVNLSLDSKGLAQKDFVVSEINIINAPSTHTYTPITGQLIVTIVGNEESIKELDSKYISVTADLLSQQQSDDDTSSFTVVPTISINHYNDVWASGEYKVIVTATRTTTPASVTNP